MMISSRVAVIGAGVSGLTCAKLLAESGYDVTIFAAESGDRTTSSAAAAIWYLLLTSIWSLIQAQIERRLARGNGSVAEAGPGLRGRLFGRFGSAGSGLR